MKNKLKRMTITVMLIMAFALLLAACRKEQTGDVSAVTNVAESITAAQDGSQDQVTVGTDTEAEAGAEAPAILENEGELEIEVPEGQDSFGE